MKAIGIIAEYNPFHNGHLYHLEKVKELFPNHVIVLILNGYFLERGEVSVLTKEEKTRISLQFGINLVIELPYVFGGQAADIFAYKSIQILNELKVSGIVFGSESNDVKLIEDIAKYTLDNKEYDTLVKSYMNDGINYPTALSKALGDISKISSPNDLLGISYIKAILKINPKMKYITIKRTNDYHDNDLDDNIVSASNVRKRLYNNEDISKYIPGYTIEKYNVDYFDLLKYKIISDNDLSRYLTVDEGIENRLHKYIHSVSSTDELITKVKTKRYTFNKINRMFIHILIGLTKEDYKKMELDYINVLGFDDIGKKYLNSIRKKLTLPIKNKNCTSLILDYELKASAIFGLITNNNTLKFENENKPIEKEVKN